MAAYVVAITGGIASGKSEAGRAFERLGVPVLDADIAARLIVEPGTPALAEIVARFGPKVLQADGSLDRGELRRRVFDDRAARRELEAITHPRIRSWLANACRLAPGPYAVAAIPLLAEGGGRIAYPWLQRILVVDVPVSLQFRRLLARDAVDEPLAERMIAAQASRQQRLALADDVIVNDGSLADMTAAVRRLDRRYRQWAER